MKRRKREREKEREKEAYLVSVLLSRVSIQEKLGFQPFRPIFPLTLHSESSLGYFAEPARTQSH